MCRREWRPQRKHGMVERSECRSGEGNLEQHRRQPDLQRHAAEDSAPRHSPPVLGHEPGQTEEDGIADEGLEGREQDTVDDYRVVSDGRRASVSP